MTLLFITQKLHEQDAFAVLWIEAFRRAGYTVKVLCLENRAGLQPFEILSMGKEKGYGKIRQTLQFWHHIRHAKYDRVFLHMSPVWGLLGSWYWVPKRIPVYLWYTHYKLSLSMRVTGWYAKRFFCATSQSLPQYEGSPKKIVTGHGIDLTIWKRSINATENPHRLLMVHRLSRSKRIELSLRALTLLPPSYTLDIYGIPAEANYATEMQALVKELGLEKRALFHGTVPMAKLSAIYTHHRLILNMASETIDKTMLEAMTCGCYPVTTKANAKAIGIPAAPEHDTPEAIASFITAHAESAPVSPEEMYRTVEERHSLEKLITTMDQLIRSGS